MEWLQTLLDSSNTPAVTALLLGLITAISPCPLATNIAAVGFIGKDIGNRRRVFANGLLYTLGRTVAYTLLGIALIAILKKGASLFGIQQFISEYGENILGPALLLIGLFMLVGNKLKLPSLGMAGNGENLARKGGWGALLLGMLFAMAFCPTSGVFLFRDADTHVRDDRRRLFFTGIFCHSNRTACFGCCLDTGVQHTTYQQISWKNASDPKVGKANCRKNICRHWHILLYHHLFIERLNYGNQSFRGRLRKVLSRLPIDKKNHRRIWN